MNRIRSMLVAVAAVLGLLLAGQPVTPAFATESTCYGKTCAGLDPSKTVCARDARTIMSRTAVARVDYGVLELRYSPRCYSNWVRFTPWGGAAETIGWVLRQPTVRGTPYIWRKGVSGSLQGYAGQAFSFSVSVTQWSKMVTATGTTCSSVEIYSTDYSNSGQGERRPLGTYNAPCVS